MQAPTTAIIHFPDTSVDSRYSQCDCVFMEPSYLSLHASGELKKRAKTAVEALSRCTLCPHACAINRREGEQGVCQTGRLARVGSFDLHFGEESPLVGTGGSGTIFFARCNLRCVFCQNSDLSRPIAQNGEPCTEVYPNQLAWMMLELQKRGAENINFVSPSHVAAQILEALPEAVESGLRLPLVYNSGGYDSVETLRLLDGVFDIYMPDTKFWDDATAKRLCSAKGYPEAARRAIAEMHRQVGDLRLNDQGMAIRGVLVRHLVMPNDLAGTKQWMHFLAGLSKNIFVNIMEQYHPCAGSHEIADIARTPTELELKTARASAAHAGLTRLYTRPGGAFHFLLRKTPSRE